MFYKKGFMRKHFILVISAVLFVSFTAAQTTPDDPVPTNPAIDAPDIPQFPGKNSTALSQGLSGVLPSQASPVAKNVLNTIDKFGADPGKALGEALQGVLGDGQAGNITEG